MQVETRVIERRLRDLEPSDRNARAMTAQQLERLTENLTHDGALTSAPLVYKTGSSPAITGSKRRSLPASRRRRSLRSPTSSPTIT